MKLSLCIHNRLHYFKGAKVLWRDTPKSVWRCEAACDVSPASAPGLGTRETQTREQSNLFLQSNYQSFTPLPARPTAAAYLQSQLQFHKKPRELVWSNFDIDVHQYHNIWKSPQPSCQSLQTSTQFQIKINNVFTSVAPALTRIRRRLLRIL